MLAARPFAPTLKHQGANRARASPQPGLPAVAGNCCCRRSVKCAGTRDAKSPRNVPPGCQLISAQTAFNQPAPVCVQSALSQAMSLDTQCSRDSSCCKPACAAMSHEAGHASQQADTPCTLCLHCGRMRPNFSLQPAGWPLSMPTFCECLPSLQCKRRPLPAISWPCLAACR